MNTAPGQRRRRFPWLIYWLVLAVVLILMLLPVFSVIFAATVANTHGCALDEGSVHPCMVNGSDWGEALYDFAVMGWLAIATLPLGGGALIVWLVILIIHRQAWRRNNPEGISP
ncbi:MAG TPA: hypothetical protein VGM83_02590 [Devosiaceae bacterium]|jgi:hypothetical protein